MQFSLVLEYQAGQDDDCKLRTVGNWYAMTGYGLGFPRGSKWKPIMDKALHKLSYEGAMERLQKFWLKGNPNGLVLPSKVGPD